MRRLIRFLLICVIIVGAFYVADQVGWIEIQDDVKEGAAHLWHSGTEHAKAFWKNVVGRAAGEVKDRYESWAAKRTEEGQGAPTAGLPSQTQRETQQSQQNRQTPSSHELVMNWNEMLVAADRGQYAKAIQLAQQGQVLEPDNRDYLEQEGYIYYEWAREASWAEGEEAAAALFAKSGEAMERAITRAQQDGAHLDELHRLHSWAASAFYHAGDRQRAVDAAQRGLQLEYDNELDTIVHNIQQKYNEEGEYKKAIELLRYLQTLTPDRWDRIFQEAMTYRRWGDQVEQDAGFSAARPFFEQAAAAYTRAIAKAVAVNALPGELAVLHYARGNLLHNMATHGTPEAAALRQESLYHMKQAIHFNADGERSIPWAHYHVASAIHRESPASMEAKAHFEKFLDQYEPADQLSVDYVLRTMTLIDELHQKLYGDPGVPKIVTAHGVFLGFGVSLDEVRAYAAEFEERTVGAVERDLGLRATSWPVVFNLYGDESLWQDTCGNAGAAGCYSGVNRQVHIAHWQMGQVAPEVLAHEYIHWLAYEEARIEGAPSWFHEGLAESVGVRVQVTSAPWGSDRLASDWQAVLQGSASPAEGLTYHVDEMLDYAYAHTAVAHLVETKGLTALRNFLKMTQAGHTFELAFAEAFDITPEAYQEEYARVVDVRRQSQIVM